MSSNGSESVGVRLKRLRLEQGLSQRDLSSPGTSYAYISRIEAGARTPSVKALRALARKLGVTVEYLETGRDHTLDDDLMMELFARTRSPLRISAIPFRTFLRWTRGGEERSAIADTLTEALLAAVRREREIDRLRGEQARLAEQEAELAR